ncbi:MAG: NUDIX hydrolase [Bacteroidota bacterium]
MYNVYFNERLIRFMDLKGSIQGGDLILRLNGQESPALLQQLLAAFETNKMVGELYFQCVNLEASWETFCSLYLVMEAAGGLVTNQQQELLMIFRNGFWDLPKGKVEVGEEKDTAAIREVYEECGVGMLELGDGPFMTYHIYPYHEQQVLKFTYWYKMGCSDDTTPVPQQEEGITEACWLNKEEVEIKLGKAYHSIAQLIREKYLAEDL